MKIKNGSRTISGISLSEFISLALIVVLSLESLYSRGKPTGQYSAYILILLIGLGILNIILKYGGKFKKKEILLMLVSLMFALWGFSSESIRVALTLLLVIIWNKIDLRFQKVLARIIIILGMLFSYPQISSGASRVSGFFNTSPTIFAVTLMICSTYLLFSKSKTRIDDLLVIVSVVIINYTKTRSVLIVMVLLIGIHMMNNLVKTMRMNKRTRNLVIAVVGLIMTVVIFMNIQEIWLAVSRENSGGSDSTRTKMWIAAIKQLMLNPLNILFGFGGGASLDFIKTTFNIDGYFPIHQDFIQLVFDYGIFGLLIVKQIFFGKTKWKFVSIVVLVAASFHNILLSPIPLLLLIIFSNDLVREETI